MNTYTRGRPQGQDNIAEKRHGNVYTQGQDGVVPGRREDGADRPFPNKPVSHRRPLNPGKQDSFNLYDLDKKTITKQPRGQMPPRGHDSKDIRETTGSQHPRKHSQRQPSGELEMAKAIHAKELMLQEKLWSVEEKIRQKIQRDTAVGCDQRSEEQRLDRRQAERGHAQTKTRLSEQQRREPVRNREMMMQERRQEDVRQHRKSQDRRNKDRMRNTHEEGWKRGEIDVAQTKGHKGTHQITDPKQEESGELNKSKWEHTRRKGGDEKDNSIWGETGLRLQDGAMKAKEREQNTTSMTEKKYTDRTSKEMFDLDVERDMPQMNQQKTPHKATAENHRGAGRKLSEGPSSPPVSHPSHFSRPEKEELRQEDDRDASLQLLPCRVCNRKFASERLQKHIQVCKKTKQSQRSVFNSYASRTKGTAIEEFWKTHSRSRSPEVLKKKNPGHYHKSNTRNLQEGRLPAGTSQPKQSK
ncbi:uncharacterized protein LOC117267182 [Epinephelus lanceolatus]|uniref:trichohyalin n=1 Tax=Epinephelus lanceolatus TaxID=310571 RepID=UPI0014472F73|nr:trichohyalin [Epinephelus lanceolatus]